MKCKQLGALLTCAAMVLSMAGCGSASEAGSTDTIKIGAIYPVTGNYAYEAEALVNASQMAIDKINEAGGIASLGGAKLELVVGDSQASPDVASSEAERLISEGCVALTGTFTSSTIQTASQVSEENGIPFLVTIGANVSLMDRGFNYLYRMQPNAEQFSLNLIECLKEMDLDGVETAVLIHEDSMSGTDNASIIEEHMDETGIKLLGNISYSTSATSLSSEVTRLAELDPDMIIDIGYFSDTSMLMSEINERGLSFKMICGVANGGFSDTKFISDFGDAAENICDLNYRYNPLKESTVAMMQEYEETYGSAMSVHAIYGWQGMYVLADALERAGSTDPEALNNALKETSYADHDLAFSGPIVFDETGEDPNAAGVLVQIQGGKHVVVWPEEFAEADLILND